MRVTARHGDRADVRELPDLVLLEKSEKVVCRECGVPDCVDLGGSRIIKKGASGNMDLAART
jgi:hypothetical protein